ncbi:hypothetical protein GMLC_33590 [Geomonas limicola]|uniref:DUF3300 domain-containing protein n=1 Tax=Geomonas limicola TaxID=2740186 RepID=A0A6V8NBG0_9BACT|nr:DUF3300 domain-containing protein [Geomonas limicola]GFO69780.1 hypothetical protein GMLC_33590 [Geomonas limicola]
MRKLLFIVPLLAIIAGFSLSTPVWAQSEPGYYSASDLPNDNLLSPEELDDLLAPIALYPDPLLAQILPAATFVDQIDEAARFVRFYGNSPRIDDQPWDISVRAVAHYPDILFMMDRKYDWTVALGQAYIDQPQDVMESIQVLRAQARDRGNLYSTTQQQVIVEPGGDIRIVPAVPQYIYVPVYDPQVIYVESRPSYGYLTFGTGFVIGAWLCRDVDWRDHRVYYHGWRRGGWVERSRPHIHDRRGVYINQRSSTIVINRRVLQRDTSRYRQELRQETVRRRDLPGRPVTPVRRDGRPGRDEHRTPALEQRPRVEQGHKPDADRGRRQGTEQRPQAAPTTAPAPRGDQHPAAGTQPGSRGEHRTPAGQTQPSGTRPTPPAPQSVTPAPAAPSPAPPAATPAGKPNQSDLYRGRDTQRSQPASRSGYGGYGSNRDATIYRERGQSSREQMHGPGERPVPQGAPAAVKPAPAPAAVRPAPAAPRPAVSAPAPRPAAAPAPRPQAPRPSAPPASERPAQPEGNRDRR